MENNSENEIISVHIDDIIPNRFQPRLSFNEKSLNELADSIKQHGMIQPLVVRKLGDKYEIIAGERRFKAANIIGMNTVPVIVMNLDDNKSAEIAVVENIQRQDLSSLEEAKSYKKILDKGYLTQEELASRMGKTQATISNKIRLLTLAEEVQEALLKRKISERHARSLLSLNNHDQQIEILNKIINNKLTVKETDDFIKNIKQPLLDKQSNLTTEEFVEVDENKTEPLEKIINNIEQLNISDINEIDINKIKEEAVDINPPREEIDINNLLIKPQPEIDNRIEKPIEVEKKEEKPNNNRFIFELEEEAQNHHLNEGDIAEKDQKQFDVDDDLTNTNLLINEYKENKIDNVIDEPTPLPGNGGDLKDVIQIIRESSEKIEKIGYNIDLEEFDFEDLYQINIKINKNRSN